MSTKNIKHFAPIIALLFSAAVLAHGNENTDQKWNDESQTPTTRHHSYHQQNQNQPDTNNSPARHNHDGKKKNRDADRNQNSLDNNDNSRDNGDSANDMKN